MNRFSALRSAVWAAIVIAATILSAGCLDLQVSPDGKRVAFTWIPDTLEKTDANFRLAMMNVDGTGFRYLPWSDDAGYIRWSPSGKYVAYWHDAQNVAQVYTVATLGIENVPVENVSGYTWVKDDVLALLVSNEGDSSVVWYDFARQQITGKLDLPTDISGFTELYSVPNSSAFLVRGNPELWFVKPGAATSIYEDRGNYSIFISDNGDRAFLTYESQSPEERLFSIVEISLVNGTRKEIAMTRKIAGANEKAGMKPKRSCIIACSPDLSKAIFSIEYDKRGPLNNGICKTFLYDFVRGSAKDLSYANEQGSIARWSPQDDKFAIITISDSSDRSFISLRWLESDGKIDIPLATCHLKDDRKGGATASLIFASETKR